METVSRTITEKDGEKRELVQIVIKDEDGRISHYEVPNYALRKEFETASERKFHGMLIKIINKIKEENHDIKHVQISAQVAINRIININNKRNGDLREEIRDKSIDYVIFDLNTGEIKCCIELNGSEHDTDLKTRQRDILVSKMFKGLIPLIPIPLKEAFNEEKLYIQIKEALETTKITE